MRRYFALLHNPSFARLWTGSTISMFGDALTWISMVWLVFSLTGTTAAISLLVVCYTAPVILGGFAMGAALDRFDRRRTLIVVNVVLGCAIASIPLLHAFDALRLWEIYAVAAVYGLLKMANWAGVPTLIPTLVDEEDLNTANAMESASWGIADVAGPAAAGAVIAIIGAANVLVLDAMTYAVFIAALVWLELPATIGAPAADPMERRAGLRPAFRFLRRTPAVLATTLMFMAFNVGEGMLLVLLPTIVRNTLHAGSATYGLLASTFSLAALIGSILVGAVRWRFTLGRSIAVAQTAAGVAFFGLAFAHGVMGVAATLAVAGFLASPLSIWAQTIRMRMIPDDLRGRIFGVLRTMMQATPPIGGIVAGAAIGGPGVLLAVVSMGAVMAVPGLLGMVTPALADQQVRAEEMSRT
ncbi:MAG: MFS transporter [Actinomycetota bacterium]